MLRLRIFLFTTAAACVFLAAGPADGQERIPPERRAVSPVGIAQHTEGKTYMKVTYGRPSVRGRTIFGDLVPFGAIWRTGANEATEITLTGDVQIGDERLDAGTYSIYTTPDHGHWTVHFNSAVGGWGAYEYNADLDVLTIHTTPETLEEPVEMFTIYFDDEEEQLYLVMAWDRTAVRVPIRPVTGSH